MDEQVIYLKGLSEGAAESAEEPMSVGVAVGAVGCRWKDAGAGQGEAGCGGNAGLGECHGDGQGQNLDLGLGANLRNEVISKFVVSFLIATVT